MNSTTRIERSDDEGKAGSRRDRMVATTLIVCIAVVAFWEIMAHRSDRAFSPFELVADDFVAFRPTCAGWDVEFVPVNPDPVEPNILMYVLRSDRSSAFLKQRPLVQRLVHGFNLVDCMVEKGHRVELFASTREGDGGEGVERLPPAVLNSGTPLQVWRVVSPTGDAAVWLSTMLRAGDFAATDVDTRAMPFPRVPFPEHAGWTPRGFTKEGLKHPVQGLKKYFKYKWNSSRGDFLTMIDLKQEEWASENDLTLVTLSDGASVKPEDVDAIIAEMFAVHFEMHAQLIAWRKRTLDAGQAQP